MKDEIKEILDILKTRSDRYNYYLKNNMAYENKIDDYQAYLLLDYITNLQQIEQEHQKLNGELREENKRIFSKVNDDELLISNAMNYAEAQKYKSRNQKAIEYILELKQNSPDEKALDKLLNISQGSDKDE